MGSRSRYFRYLCRAAGLGDILQLGVNASDGTSIIIAGVLPISIMAIIGDVFLTWLENKLDPIAN